MPNTTTCTDRFSFLPMNSDTDPLTLYMLKKKETSHEHRMIESIRKTNAWYRTRLGRGSGGLEREKADGDKDPNFCERKTEPRDKKRWELLQMCRADCWYPQEVSQEETGSLAEPPEKWHAMAVRSVLFFLITVEFLSAKLSPSRSRFPIAGKAAPLWSYSWREISLSLLPFLPPTSSCIAPSHRSLKASGIGICVEFMKLMKTKFQKA